MTMTTTLALALLHGGHGHDGDSPDLLLRLWHYLSEPQHVGPAVLGALVVAAVVLRWRRRRFSRR
jgi:MYXO-CTERM domain-containing protein